MNRKAGQRMEKKEDVLEDSKRWSDGGGGRGRDVNPDQGINPEGPMHIRLDRNVTVEWEETWS